MHNGYRLCASAYAKLGILAAMKEWRQDTEVKYSDRYETWLHASRCTTYPRAHIMKWQTSIMLVRNTQLTVARRSRAYAVVSVHSCQGTRYGHRSRNLLEASHNSRLVVHPSTFHPSWNNRTSFCPVSRSLRCVSRIANDLARSDR